MLAIWTRRFSRRITEDPFARPGCLPTGSAKSVKSTSLKRLAARAVWVCLACVTPIVSIAQSPSPLPTKASPPSWAFVVEPAAAPDAGGVEEDSAQKKVPGSDRVFTRAEISDRFKTPDWFPADHAPMPPIVAFGRKPGVMACGYCHLPNGQGRPENAGLAGLPAAYIQQQVADIKAGLRRTSSPLSLPPALMLATAAAADEAEVRSATAYFAGLNFKPWIRVVETGSVPKMHIEGYMFVPLASGGTEAIGQRIIEAPENVARTQLRDSRTGFVAYVPVGSISRGEALVTTGGAGKTIRCGICHGPDLKGLATVPPIAGRSPSYIVRQLYDMQSQSRRGLGTELMQEAVAKLTVEDMVAIAAYVASRSP